MQKPVRIEELPKFREVKGDRKGETLLNLYLYLKPDGMGKVDVDVRKIKMNYNQLSRWIKKVQDLFTDKRDKKSVGLMWMNQGPSASHSVPEGKIYLYKNYMQGADNDVE